MSRYGRWCLSGTDTSAGSGESLAIRLNRHRSARSKAAGKDKDAVRCEGLVQAAIGKEAQHGRHGKVTAAGNASNNHDFAVVLYGHRTDGINVCELRDHRLLRRNAAMAEGVVEVTCLSGLAQWNSTAYLCRDIGFMLISYG